MTPETSAQRQAKATDWLKQQEDGGKWVIEKDDAYPVINNFRITVRKIEGADREYLSELLSALAAQIFPDGAMAGKQNIAAPVSVGHVWWTFPKSERGMDNTAILWQVLVSGGAADAAGNRIGNIFTFTNLGVSSLSIETKYYDLDKAAVDLLALTISTGVGAFGNNHNTPQLDEDTGRWSGTITTTGQSQTLSTPFFEVIGITGTPKVEERDDRDGVKNIWVTVTTYDVKKSTQVNNGYAWIDGYGPGSKVDDHGGGWYTAKRITNITRTYYKSYFDPDLGQYGGPENVGVIQLFPDPPSA